MQSSRAVPAKPPSIQFASRISSAKTTARSRSLVVNLPVQRDGFGFAELFEAQIQRLDPTILVVDLVHDEPTSRLITAPAPAVKAQAADRRIGASIAAQAAI